MGRATALIVSSIFATVASAATVPDIGWSAYGGDAGGTRYSTAAQITPANVARLEVAWTFRTGELGQGVKDWSRSAFEATPILHDGTLYLTTSSTDVVAVNAVTGQLRWRHASRSRDDLHYSDGVSRGVSLWVDPSSPPDAVCHARIFAPTLDGRLLALDAATGKPALSSASRAPSICCRTCDHSSRRATNGGTISSLRHRRSSTTRSSSVPPLATTAQCSRNSGSCGPTMPAVAAWSGAGIRSRARRRIRSSRSGTPRALRAPVPPTPGRRCRWMPSAGSCSCPRVRRARISSAACDPAITAGRIPSWPWTALPASCDGDSNWCTTISGTTTWRRNRRW
ncbi:MAG: PQQ-binding-like beta-propeller repeat protein [Proteobacteria bacterium]|nr:PQQ-binding-like beta-propeller repeat protein [Pseudomonadota bacterium]